jgi:hypothetical protein
MIRLLRIKLYLNFGEDPRPQYIYIYTYQLIKNREMENTSFPETDGKDHLFICL